MFKTCPRKWGSFLYIYIESQKYKFFPSEERGQPPFFLYTLSTTCTCSPHPHFLSSFMYIKGKGEMREGGDCCPGGVITPRSPLTPLSQKRERGRGAGKGKGSI